MSKNEFTLSASELEALTGPVLKITDEDIGFLPEGGHKKQAEIHKLRELSYLLDKYTEAQKTSGMDKWFVPGTPFSIEACPKHKAFFEAGARYNQRMFMAANR